VPIVADVHVERFGVREQALIDLGKDARPDAILFSGDFLNLSYVHDARALADARTLWAALSAIAPLADPNSPHLLDERLYFIALTGMGMLATTGVIVYCQLPRGTPYSVQVRPVIVPAEMMSIPIAAVAGMRSAPEAHSGGRFQAGSQWAATSSPPMPKATTKMYRV